MAALKIASRYSNDNIDTIAMELLQNARRAGARHVRVSIDGAMNAITVADDGHGLSSEEAETLLTFGGSHTNAATEADEAPTGTGFFTLARRGATVRSKDWKMIVSPSAFLGLSDAVITTGLTAIVGTTVTFPNLGAKRTRQLSARHAFESAALAMPFTTNVDGQTVRRWKPQEILVEDGRPTYQDLLSRTIADCTVIVARFEDIRRRRREAQVPGVPESGTKHEAWLDLWFDVFGQIIRYDHKRLRSLHPALSVEAEGEILTRPASRARWTRRLPGYIAIVETLGSQSILPRLPERRELVRTDGLDLVAEAIAQMIAQLASRAPRNAVPDAHPIRLLGARVGVEIPPRQHVVETFRPSELAAWPAHSADAAPRPLMPILVVDNGNVEFRSPAFDTVTAPVLVPDAGRIASGILAVGIRHDPFAFRSLAQANATLPDLDAARRLTLTIDDRHVVLGDDGRFDDESIQARWASASVSEPRIRIASKIEVKVETARGKTLRAGIPFAVVRRHDWRLGVAFVATAQTNIAELVDSLVRVARWFDEGSEDGPETQLKRFKADVEQSVRLALLPPATVAAEAVAEFVEGLEGPGIERVDVTFDDAGAAKVTVTLRDGTTGSNRNETGGRDDKP